MYTVRNVTILGNHFFFCHRSGFKEIGMTMTNTVIQRATEKEIVNCYVLVSNKSFRCLISNIQVRRKNNLFKIIKLITCIHFRMNF